MDIINFLILLFFFIFKANRLLILNFIKCNANNLKGFFLQEEFLQQTQIKITKGKFYFKPILIVI